MEENTHNNTPQKPSTPASQHGNGEPAGPAASTPQRPQGGPAGPASTPQPSSADYRPVSKARIVRTVLFIAVPIVLALAALCWYFATQLDHQKEENTALQELAEMDKAEMQTEYQKFDQQYQELQNQLSNDSLIAQIEQERERTQQLLRELENTRATDAREIARLKREIASLRAVLQSYIVQVDSLNQANQALRTENAEIRETADRQQTQISQLSSERTQLRERVDRAAQLDATAFWVKPRNRRGRDTQKAKDVKRIAFGFTLVKNVTATNGQRTVYARILKPDNSVYKPSGHFAYEDTQLDYSEKTYVEYDGQERAITLYSDVEEFLAAGTYKVYIFTDNQMVGQTAFTLK